MGRRVSVLYGVENCPFALTKPVAVSTGLALQHSLWQQACRHALQQSNDICWGQSKRSMCTLSSIDKPPVRLHTNLYSLPQLWSLNVPEVVMQIHRALFWSGWPAAHLRKVDILLSSQYCADGDGSVLDAEYLYRPIQLLDPLHTHTPQQRYLLQPARHCQSANHLSSCHFF